MAQLSPENRAKQRAEASVLVMVEFSNKPGFPEARWSNDWVFAKGAYQRTLSYNIHYWKCYVDGSNPNSKWIGRVIRVGLFDATVIKEATDSNKIAQYENGRWEAV